MIIQNSYALSKGSTDIRRLSLQTEFSFPFESPQLQPYLQQSTCLLSFGCGTGDYEAKLHEHYPLLEKIIGLNIDTKQLQKARHDHPTLQFRLLDITKKLPPRYWNTYDTCFTRFVMQHIPTHIEAIIKNMAQGLRTQGYCCIIEYNEKNTHIPQELPTLKLINDILFTFSQKHHGNRDCCSQIEQTLHKQKLFISESITVEKSNWPITPETAQTLFDILLPIVSEQIAPHIDNPRNYPTGTIAFLKQLKQNTIAIEKRIHREIKQLTQTGTYGIMLITAQRR